MLSLPKGEPAALQSEAAVPRLLSRSSARRYCRPLVVFPPSARQLGWERPGVSLGAAPYIQCGFG